MDREAGVIINDTFPVQERLGGRESVVWAKCGKIALMRKPSQPTALSSRPSHLSH